MAITVSNEYREVVKLFNSLASSKSLWQVFFDCIEMYSLSISNSIVIGTKFENNEKRYLDISSTYSKEQMQIIVQILAEITRMIEKNPFRDTLGRLYMQLDMGSKGIGQFFTPYNVSLAMAKMSLPIDEVNKKIKEKGYITVNEPTVGGGAAIIAACETLHINDINYQKHAVFVCQDLSRIAAMMCHVVLSLMGCCAVIKIGDTLSDPYTCYYKEERKGSELLITPMFVINNGFNKV